MITASVAVFILVVHWHSVCIGVGASMVDARGIIADYVVLACSLCSACMHAAACRYGIE